MIAMRGRDGGVREVMATGMGVSAMIHAVGIIGAIVWFGLNGLLGYAKPSDFVWLAG
jgi:hypothetical protein